MKTFSMFVISHKKITHKLPKNYIPIQVGKKNTKSNLPYISDDTGDNISNKNKNYCELTAIYWLYKNYDLPKYVGICHYRRFFVNGFLTRLINEKYVVHSMKNYDVILPKKFVTEKNVYYHFINSGSGFEKDLKNLERVIEKNYPEYLNEYYEVMSSKASSFLNMCVMKKEDFKNYCSWLFDILFKVEKETNMDGYNVQQQRLYGFLSEFLINVWIKHNNLRVKYCHIYLYDENINSFIRFFRRLKLGLKEVFKL